MSTTVQPETQPTSTPAAPVVEQPANNLTQSVADELLGGKESPKDPFNDTPQNDPFAGVDEPKPDEPQPVDAQQVTDPTQTPEPEVTPIPFKYTVDGQEKTFDGIEEVPGEGLIVTPEAIPRVKDALQMAERLAPQVQQYARELDRFQKLGGYQRIEQLEANSAVLQAIGTKFLELLSDQEQTPDGFPAKLAELATDPRARALQLRELDILTRDAEINARQQFGTKFRGFDQEAQAATSRTSAVSTAVQTMAKAVADMGMAITVEDMAEAEQVFGPLSDAIYRPATAQEAASLRIPVGTPIIDYPKMHPWFTARAQLRAREATGRSSAAAATAENATRLAAATPTRPANKPAVTQRPGAGNPKLNPARPDITDWKTRMRMGLSPVVPDSSPNP